MSNLPSGGGGGSSGVTLVHTATYTGASPHSLSATDIQEGDVVIAAMTTRNSVAFAITGGSTWHELWHDDLSSDEEVRVYWKVAGPSEPSSYEWTHSAGVTVASAIAIYRGLDGTLIYYGQDRSRNSLCILGSNNGLHIVIMQCCYQATSLVMYDPTNELTEDVNYSNNDQGIIISRRDALQKAAMPQFWFSGGNGGYVSAGAIVIE